MKSKRLIAFTLIELLVVIAIVGILSGFVLVSLNSATDSAKDVKTKNDLAAISRAILTYHALNNAYPIEETPCSIGDGTCLNELVPNHIQSFPLDFNNTRYQYSSDGTSYTLTGNLTNERVLTYDSETGFSESDAEQGLPGYAKRQPITINSASALTDYQVKLIVAYDTDMQPDFDDLRFTSSDQTTELSYWLESKTDSTTATIWVKIPSLASGDNTIYMYYANASATTASNGDNTFVFFDDFENGNLSKWSQYNPSYPASISTEWSSRARTYSAKIVKPAADTDCGITRTINESSVQVIVDAKITSIGSGAGLYIRIPGGSQLSSVTTVSDWTVTWTATAPKALNLTSYQWVGASPMTGYYDCVRIKKYNNPEPTVSAWGNEQP